MRILAGLNSSRYAFISNKGKPDYIIKADGKTVKILVNNLDGFPSNSDVLQKINKVIFKLAKSASSINLILEKDFLPENESFAPVKLQDNTSLMGHDIAEIVCAGEDRLQLSNEGLEELVVNLVKAMNEVLGFASKEINHGAGSSGGLTINGDGLQTLKEIILSALNSSKTVNDGSLNVPLLSVKFMTNGLLGIDHQSLKDAISSNTGEVARAVKVVAQALCDTLPLCIDPNSGILIYTGKRIEDDEGSNASKALNAIDEELERERAELDTQLRAIDELISYSSRLIDDLKHQPEMISCDG